MSSRRGLTGLSPLVLLLHVGLALTVLAAAAAPSRRLLAMLREPVTLAAEQVSLAWAIPIAFCALYLAGRLAWFALGRRAGVGWTWSALVALFAVVAARGLAPGQPVGFKSILGAPPTLQSVVALKALQKRALDGIGRDGRVPDAAQLSRPIEVDGRELIPGYSYRGRSRPFRIVRVERASGPVDRVRPGDLPGTLYVAVAPDGRHFWMTAVVLVDEEGRPTAEMLPGPGPSGILVLGNAG